MKKALGIFFILLAIVGMPAFKIFFSQTSLFNIPSIVAMIAGIVFILIGIFLLADE